MLGRENRPASRDAKGKEGRARQRGRSRARSLGCLFGGEVLKGVSPRAGHVALSFLFSVSGQELGMGRCFQGLVA